MFRFLTRWEPQLYAILRIVTGLLFALHGTQKLFGFPGDQPPAGSELMIAAGVIECFGGAAVALGFLTPLAAFLCSGEMAVAYFKVHFPQHWLPNLNQGEAAVLYCFLFLYIAARGGGKWSIDRERK
ncbi:MAG TPA: DoxX family protein [Thermoanaerobaculia bacterium]|nr:DoxX family protein [Thermoanaerobaculia bacterium]